VPTQENEKNLNLKAPAAILDPQKQVTQPMVPEPQKTPVQPMVSDYHITPIKNPQSNDIIPICDDIEQTDAKEETDESDVSEGRELISDPLLRSNLESL
ncbi:16764_t:CDS:2, partial [Dentiscutata heterogama]